MNVLLLGPERASFESILRSAGDAVTRREEKITGPEAVTDFNFLISYGYRYLIPTPVLQHFKGRAINLHIALLPWNRGADPNLWSFLENTPKGVTIHLLDEHLDTGAILAQKDMTFEPRETLRGSYTKLSAALEKLFADFWPAIRLGQQRAVPQPAGGSVHRVADRLPYEHLLTQGWDTPVQLLIGKALIAKEGSRL